MNATKKESRLRVGVEHAPLFWGGWKGELLPGELLQER